MLLPKSYYQNEDVLFLAKDLLGKILLTEIDGIVCSGIIVETEAYRAPDDKACHAYENRCTQRTKTMFGEGGQSYIYLCYGIHHLFNVVTAKEGQAHAVLVRAIEPLTGIEHMLKRRNAKVLNPKLSKGPGSLTKALGIVKLYNGIDLFDSKSPIRIYEKNIIYTERQIECLKRIGVEYAEESAHWLWRYYVKENPYVSANKNSSHVG